ncbi:hypothetical protein FRC14_007542 [Serendipita sp. 396]|nr:hypothetical protein FRC14_007542 [Serendipita sp. 396]KAG8775544.1 hypothetical protein FRC15_000469 [Serendipita sp. 397]KAG8816497.1 hypothetical protein FRC19_011990 [Serendipita sp. 401]KAG8864397.1 hypothetical protein FRC20_010259 [Serendipita sp. 405]
MTVELSTVGDNFLMEKIHLVLELNWNDGHVEKVDLLSRKSSPGVWDAKKPLILPKIIPHFTLSVFAELGGEERQLLASQEMYGPNLCDRIGESFVIPLNGHGNHPSMIIKTEMVTGTHLFRQTLDAEREAVTSAPNSHPDKPHRSFNLGISLHTRLEHLVNLDDMDKAIAQNQAAVNLTPDGHPHKPSLLNKLGYSLRTRFERFGNLDDIDSSISLHQSAVNLTQDGHPYKPGRLSNLGISYHIRFERLGNLDDIDDAIESLQAAVNLIPDGHPHKPSQLSNLGHSLLTRFERLGNLNDMENAIVRHQAAANLTPDGHPHKPGRLSNLGGALHTRFESLGNLDDIDNAIAKIQAAVNLTPDGRPDKPSLLNNLGHSLLTRFARLGNLNDMDNAVARLQAAVALTPVGHPNEHSQLNNLGNSLRIRFERLGNLNDIDNAIAKFQAAVNLTPDGHFRKPSLLSNLETSLVTRFERLGNLDDIDNAIVQYQVAVNLTPDGHPHKPNQLNNLGNSLVVRFERLGSLNDMDNAISNRLSDLGDSLLTQFQRLGHPYDAEACIAQLSEASSSPVGSPSVRLIAARKWIYVASTTGHSSLLAACECAISIIPLVAWLGLSISDRHQHLIQIGGIVRDTAAIAISLGQYDKAVEWLEQGRSIVWTQILQLRTLVDQLRVVEPDLAARLLHISSLLDQGNQNVKPHNGCLLSSEEEARQYRALAEERDEIVEKVRSLPQFQDFLRPLRLRRLLDAAIEGPVVVVNVSKKRCDALALVYGADDVAHIPLPDLTSERVEQLQVEFSSLLKSSRVRLRAVRDPEIEVGGDDECKRILAELWHRLVKPVLDSLSFSHDPDTLPRIWWCVTGQLAFLPVHAAGVYGTEGSSRQIQDYAISSYAPTISALLAQVDAPVQKPFRHLSAIEPSSGSSYIPNTEKELECIRHRLQNRDHVVLHKTDATRERVMNAMRDCNWLHLACHGTQNAKEPTKSSLLLHDGQLTLEEIIRLNLPEAEFAFLSACQTMMGDEELSDEAVHIAGGMSLAGYRSVVATMWSIEDALAPKVADKFYARLLEDGERPDNRKVAEALYFSLKKLREEEKDLQMLSWLPFVHLGI